MREKTLKSRGRPKEKFYNKISHLSTYKNRKMPRNNLSVKKKIENCVLDLCVSLHTIVYLILIMAVQVLKMCHDLLSIVDKKAPCKSHFLSDHHR